ncbi:membrane protein [Streptacidiphilus anmyonensis]|uniref:membrane protein n=1 Tax=Streptacidiphilus anmyonensis TaxID=405782 RepID=UPI0005A64128|nr:membrane protein [Streptacidiphilus anmyonensis]
MSMHSHATRGFRLPALARRQHTQETSAVTTLSAADCALAALRVLVGFVFLWAFLDKAFGLGYATPSAKAWIHGGSPTKGFLGSVAVGPLQSTFHSWAGQGWADWLFMLGLLGIGLAVMSGVALRVSALAGTVLLGLMWLAEFPPAQHLATGAPSMSSNPFVDYHVAYAAALVAVAATTTGSKLGLGRLWARLPVVRDHAWLR